MFDIGVLAFLFVTMIANLWLQREVLNYRSVVCAVLIAAALSLLFQFYVYFDIGHLDPFFLIAFSIQVFLGIVIGLIFAWVKKGFMT